MIVLLLCFAGIGSDGYLTVQAQPQNRTTAGPYNRKNHNPTTVQPQNLITSKPDNRINSITLEQCKAWARENYPIIKKYDLVEQSRRLTVENAAKAWLPQVSLSGGASYQSDVTTIPIDIPDIDIPTLSKDQYDVNVTVSQQLYDGGTVASAKRVAEAQGDVEREQVNVAMYDINGRIDQLFFGLLMLDEQIAQVRVLQDDLRLTLSSVTAMMNGGTANQTDVDAVMVEQIKAGQKETSLLTQRQTYLRMLETFTGKTFNAGDTLVRPALPDMLTTDNLRPELALYDAQNRLLDMRMKALDTAIRPRLGIYARGGYGNPALNLLKNEFDAYYKVGVTLSWNFGSLYTRSNDRRKIETDRRTVEAEREAFLFNSRLQTEMQNGAISNLRKQIEQDDEIIKLRSRIREKAAQRVANGTETVNEMLRDINAVSDARLSKRLHEVQLIHEIYKLKNINNN